MKDDEVSLSCHQVRWENGGTWTHECGHTVTTRRTSPTLWKYRSLECGADF